MRRRPALTWPRALVVSVVVSAAVILIAAWLAASYSAGSFVDWVGALATLAAFLAAVVAALYAVGGYRRDLADRHSAQASQVAAWVGQRDSSGDSPAAAKIARFSRDSRFMVDGIYMRNASDLPVSQFEFRVYVADEPCGPRATVIGVLPPASEPLFVGVSKDDMTVAAAGVVVVGGEHRVGIAFKDTRGARWYRAPDGTLSEGPPPWEPTP